MDTAIWVALITGVFGIAVALIAWHSATAGARASTRNAAAEAAERTLAEARTATDAERREYERLRDKRLREFANQLGSTRQALAIARKEAEAAKAENEELRRQLGLAPGQHSEYGGPP